MITVQLQEADYVAAARLHRRWDIRMWSILVGGSFCYLLGGVLFLIYAPADQRFWAYVLFAAAVFVWLLMDWMQTIGIQRGVRRRFRQQKDLARQYAISWNDEKLTVDGEDVHVGILWTDFLKWRADDRVFTLYSARILFRIIPKRAFSDQVAIADFTRLLQEKIAPEGVIRK